MCHVQAKERGAYCVKAYILQRVEMDSSMRSATCPKARIRWLMAESVLLGDHLRLECRRWISVSSRARCHDGYVGAVIAQV